MKTHSIFFKLNILFAIALIATVFTGLLFTLHSFKKSESDLIFKSRLIMKEIRATHEVPLDLLEDFDLRLIQGSDKNKILQKAREKKIDFNHRNNQGKKPFKFFGKHVKILHYEGYCYIYVKTKKISVLLKNQQTLWSCCMMSFLIFLGVVVLLVVMYALLRKSLIPLKELQHNIISYGEGLKVQPNYLPKKDEVSLANNAFYEMIEKVDRLRDSRQLFIRNIFHELNTPVTKGKILVELVDEPKTQEMLHSLFARLATLLKELAQMERITSHHFSIETKPIRIKELIDEAADLLYLDDEIQTNITDEMMFADFSTMRLVFKNLIDNALKYGSHLSVDKIGGHIVFSSRAEALSQPLSYYTQAFSKGENIGAEKGFGLGLYIVHEILLKHGMQLFYEHKAGINYFSIETHNNF